MEEEFKKAIEQMTKKLVKQTQKDMFKKLTDKKINKITGKLNNSIKNIEVKGEPKGMMIRYNGPFYAKYIDKREPGYKNFKGFRKLPTNFLDPFRKLQKLLVDGLAKSVKEQFILMAKEMQKLVKK